MSVASRNNLQLLSSKQIIARIYNDFGIANNSLAASIYEWIGDAVQGIGYGANFDIYTTKVCIENHRGVYPCGIISVIGVLYNNQRLYLGSDLSQYGIIDWNKSKEINRELSDSDLKSLNIYLDLIDNKQTELNDYIANGGSINSQTAIDLQEQIKELQEKIKTLSYSSSLLLRRPSNTYDVDYYDTHKDYLITSFPEGEIYLIYSGVPVDDDGFPLIIDTFKYKEAVTWYCIYRMLLRGYEHKSMKDFTVPFQLWEKYRAQAINESKKFSQDDMERFKNMWASAKPNAEAWESFFINNERFNGGSYK